MDLATFRPLLWILIVLPIPPEQAEEQQPDKHKPVTSVQAPASVWLVRATCQDALDSLESIDTACNSLGITDQGFAAKAAQC